MYKSVEAMVEAICETLYEKKLENIVVLDIREMTVIADYFVICDGRSNLQVQAGSDALEDVLADQDCRHRRMEGYAQGRWIVQDYGDVIVHIFHKEEREFYNLERLWKRGNNAREYPPVGEPAQSPVVALPPTAVAVDAAL